MSLVEKWKFVGSGSESIKMHDGRTEIKTKNSEPFNPAKGSKFSKLREEGKVKPVRYRVDNGIEYKSSAKSDENSELEAEESGVEHVVSEDMISAENSEDSFDPDVISNLDLSERVVNSLNDFGVEYCDELIDMSKEQIIDIDGIGEKSYIEIIDAIEKNVS